MATVECSSLEDFRAKLAVDIRAKKAAVMRARNRAAKAALGVVRTHVPVAFGDLLRSLKLRGTTVIADAPHAFAVEYGSRPHMPPVEPIVAWCKLKGFDDPEGAAWAIAKKIAREGTKPHHFLAKSMPEIQLLTAMYLREALSESTC